MTAPDEFPILCETCLGENPFIRMTKERHGKACKICDRPFTIFRWRPGPRARFKKTEVCQTCAKLKNVCQTCILDLQFGLPVQVRDTALEEQDKLTVPKSLTNRDYMFEQYEKQVADASREGGGAPAGLLPYGKAQSSTMLNRLARRSPYYERNRPHICSFYVKGECTRGDECPYRHQSPITGELANQNIKDRFYGVNDPVAKKILREHAGGSEQGSKPSRRLGPSTPPEDQSVTSLYVGGVDGRFTEDELREVFSPHGTLSLVTLVPQKGCAFVKFESREDAEKAAEKLSDGISLHGVRLRVDWSKTSSNAGVPAYAPPPGMKSARSFAPPVPEEARRVLNLPAHPPPPPSYQPPPPGRSSARYASMNPQNYSATFDDQQHQQRRR